MRLIPFGDLDLFYEGKLTCETSQNMCRALLPWVRMPNPDITVTFVDLPSRSVQPVTESHSNLVEANVNVPQRLMLTRGFVPDDY